MTSWKFATAGNFSTTNLHVYFYIRFFFLSETWLLSLVTIKQVKIKISLNQSVKDRTRCLAIQGFVRSVPNFDRTLSVDRPLFAALWKELSALKLWNPGCLANIFFFWKNLRFAILFFPTIKPFCRPFWVLLHYTEMTDFPTLSDHILQLVKSLPSHIHVPKTSKRYPFWAELP